MKNLKPSAARRGRTQPTPAVQGEPVAWVTADTVDGQTVNGKPRCIWWENNEGVGVPIYTAPSTEQVERWRHDSEDLEALHNNLDDAGTPRHDSSGIEYSVWGRVIQYAKAAAKAEAAEQKPVLTEALRQYRNNDGSGLVFGYDRLLVDQHVAGLVEALEACRNELLWMIERHKPELSRVAEQRRFE